MGKLEKLLAKMARTPSSVRFDELAWVCEKFFGPPAIAQRRTGYIKRLGLGTPRVNIQNFDGKAKPYQVKQVLDAIRRWEEEENAD